ncbi:hypothetical protein OD917_07785 [Flavobacterium sp. SH_e]|uniref:hypothetical protein n=1 Tax=Flavobacterium TaxID=237 RepID=UPI0021E3F909|nr:hypothetical protein [Flavobacterium sp. SH_e]MCV2484821.1 hypothetical protein [Flavobacterium sp. SH_e]
MKLVLLLVFCAPAMNGMGFLELEKIRGNYLLAFHNKKLCRDMIVELNGSSDPLRLAYSGGFRAIWARHIFNPISKFETFNNGKAEIEKAVLLDPENAEIRLIRFSVQSNAPRIAGYKNNMEEDKKLIKANLQKMSSITLKELLGKLIN